MTLLGAAGLGLGTTFTGMLSHLTSSVTGEHAPDLSGLFHTITRAGGVLGAAAFGTAYLALARDQGLGRRLTMIGYDFAMIGDREVDHR
jgi:uncharacterized membrane protein YphA (DoxX/SURF4 family)